VEQLIDVVRSFSGIPVGSPLDFFNGMILLLCLVWFYDFLGRIVGWLDQWRA